MNISNRTVSDIEYNTLINMANIMAGKYCDVYNFVDDVINEQSLQIVKNNIKEYDQKYCYIISLRLKCLDLLKQIELKDILDDYYIEGAEVNSLVYNYISCNAIKEQLDENLDKKSVEELVRRRQFLSNYLRSLNKFDSDIVMKYYFYLDDPENIANEFNVDIKEIYTVIKKFREKFLNRYTDMLEKCHYDSSFLKNISKKVFNLRSANLEIFSSFKKFLRADQFVSKESLKDYIIINAFSVLGFTDIGYDYIKDESEKYHEEKKELYIPEYEEEISDEKPKEENTSIKVNRKNGFVWVSYVFFIAVVIAVIIFTVKVVNVSDKTSISEMAFGKIERVSESSLLGMTITYHKGSLGEYEINIKENYCVDNDFSISETHYIQNTINNLTRGRLSRKESYKKDFYENKTKKKYEEGDYKLIYCKELGLLYCIEYKNGKWKCSDMFNVDDYSLGKLVTVREKKYTINYDKTMGSYLLKEADEDNIFDDGEILRYINDDASIKSLNRYSYDKNISLTAYYDKKSRKIQYTVDVDDEKVKNKPFVALVCSNTGEYEYDDIYYCYPEKESYTAEFVGRINASDTMYAIEEYIKDITNEKMNKLISAQEQFSLKTSSEKYLYFDKEVYSRSYEKKFSINDRGDNGGTKIDGLYGKYLLVTSAYEKKLRSIMEDVKFCCSEDNKEIPSFSLYGKNYLKRLKNEDTYMEKLDEVSDTFKYTHIETSVKTEGNFKYAKYNDVIEILRYTGDEKDVVIPARIEDTDVVYIGNYAFKASSIESVVIPDTVKEIGYSAFSTCKMLNKVVLPEGLLSVGQEAFIYDTKLSEINWPDSVIAIGENAIDDTNWYKTNINERGMVIVGKVLYKYVDGSDFAEEIPIYDGIKGIAPGVFKYKTKIKKVSIPQSVVYVGSNAFYGMNDIEEIELKKGLKYIGDSAFAKDPKISKISIPGSVLIINDGILNNCTGLKFVEFNEGTKIIRNSTLDSATGVRGIILPETVCAISGQITENADVDIIAVKDTYAYDYAKIYKYNIINKYVAK